MFPARDIFGLLELDPNETFVPIGRLCARLGLDADEEERRVELHVLLADGARMMPTEDDDGRTFDALSLRVDLVPLWLATLDAEATDDAGFALLTLMQREAASMLWQSFRPQGFGPADELLPERHNQTLAEQAYAGALTQALLARQQMLIERKLDSDAIDGNRAAGEAVAADAQAELLARAVRRVALAAAERTRRNEYPGVYSGLYRQFSIISYRNMPRSRLTEAIEWLERWRGDLMDEPEKPPDI